MLLDAFFFLVASLSAAFAPNYMANTAGIFL